MWNTLVFSVLLTILWHRSKNERTCGDMGGLDGLKELEWGILKLKTHDCYFESDEKWGRKSIIYFKCSCLWFPKGCHEVENLQYYKVPGGQNQTAQSVMGGQNRPAYAMKMYFMNGRENRWLGWSVDRDIVEKIQFKILQAPRLNASSNSWK